MLSQLQIIQSIESLGTEDTPSFGELLLGFGNGPVKNLVGGNLDFARDVGLQLDHQYRRLCQLNHSARLAETARATRPGQETRTYNAIVQSLRNYKLPEPFSH